MRETSQPSSNQFCYCFIAFPFLFVNRFAHTSDDDDDDDEAEEEEKAILLRFYVYRFSHVTREFLLFVESTKFAGMGEIELRKKKEQCKIEIESSRMFSGVYS